MKTTDFIRHAVIIILGAGFLGYFSGTSWATPNNTHEKISVVQLNAMMKNKDFTLINVHVPYAGELPQTDLTIPYNTIEKFQNKLPKDKDTRIVVYCVGGHMSRIAAEKLNRMGYNRVLNFQDGMRGWKQHGNQVLYRSR